MTRPHTDFPISRRRVIPALCALAACVAAIPAQAQTYPSKPLRLIVAFPPGASSDLVGRIIVQKAGEFLGQQIIADNRPGAGGNVGLGATAKMPPDGYTMAIATASIAVSPSLYKNLGYDPIKDLAPIARLTVIPNIMLIHPSVPAKSLREFIDLARKNPGKLNFGSGGLGTTNHLANEMLMHLEKIRMVHVPYKGVTQAAVAMTSGEVDTVVMPVSTALPLIKSQRVRPVAVLTEERVPVLPDVPTGIEAGVKGFTMPLWYGMFAPANTPAEYVNRMSAALVKALETPEVRDRLKSMSVDPWPGGPKELAKLLHEDIERYGAVARAANLPKQ